MTMSERDRVLTKPFEDLWNDLWYKTNSDINRDKDMNISKDKFELLKKGIFIKKNEITVEYSLQKLVKNCKYKYVVDSMTTECTNNYSPIDYIDEDCFPNFSCSEWSRK
jgi:hypothetical protein